MRLVRLGCWSVRGWGSVTGPRESAPAGTSTAHRTDSAARARREIAGSISYSSVERVPWDITNKKRCAIIDHNTTTTNIKENAAMGDLKSILIDKS